MNKIQYSTPHVNYKYIFNFGTFYVLSKPTLHILYVLYWKYLLL